MATTARHIELARSLPPQLLRFFTRFPPAQVAAAGVASAPIIPDPAATTVTTTSTVSSDDPNIGATTEQAHLPPTTQPATAKKSNPFLPFHNTKTGAWHGPHYSLRRQAELYKLAQKHHVLSLMPESPKHPEIKLQKRIERGLRVQGTGEGRRVKGKKWERTLASRQEQRRLAMERMPELVARWKERGHGRGWKKWPK